LAVFGYFFEFVIPGGKGDRPLLADELEDGGEYEMLVTSRSGLYRYAIHDLIRVEGFTGTTPNVVFVSKTGEIVDVCGEKTSVSVLLDAVSAAERSVGSKVVGWCVVPDSEEKRYVFHLELEEGAAADDPSIAAAFAAAMESELFGDGILPYPVFRSQGLLLPVKVSLMRSGWMSEVVGAATNQSKPPLIRSEVPFPDRAAASEVAE
jgi:hypothetical protein